MDINLLLNAIQWNESIKMLLISVISSALGVAIAVLIYEIAGKRKNHYINYQNKEERNCDNNEELIDKINEEDNNGVTIYNRRKLAKKEYENNKDEIKESEGISCLIDDSLEATIEDIAEATFEESKDIIKNEDSSHDEQLIEEVQEIIEQPIIEEQPVKKERKPRKKKETVVEEKTEEPVIEEVQEVIEEPVIEEVQEVIEEPIIEEVNEVIEESIIEEQPVKKERKPRKKKETAVEEKTEEPVIEEVQEVIEKPVIEEVKEVIEEPIIEEQPVKKERKPRKKKESTKSKKFVPDENAKKYGFYKKLDTIDNHVKTKFYDICNEIVSNNAKPKKPSNNQSFLYKDKTIAKFDIKGDTLSLYLYFNNIKGKKIVPMRIKIRSPRSVRYSKDMINDILDKFK